MYVVRNEQALKGVIEAKSFFMYVAGTALVVCSRFGLFSAPLSSATAVSMYRRRLRSCGEEEEEPRPSSLYQSVGWNSLAPPPPLECRAMFLVLLRPWHEKEIMQRGMVVLGVGTIRACNDFRDDRLLHTHRHPVSLLAHVGFEKTRGRNGRCPRKEAF